MNSAFLNLLFDPNQSTCFTADPTGTTIKLQPDDGDIYFSINAISNTSDALPSQPWHNKDVPRRADHNVVCLRNFLIELDNMPLESQISFVTSKLPVSSIVYSGNKSYHFIVSLQEPLNSIQEYKDLSKRILSVIEGSDKSTINPSRLSRLPDVLRPDTKKMQTLEYLGQRIENSKLLAMLPTIQHLEPISTKRMVSTDFFKFLDKPDEAISMLKLNGRNMFFFWLGKRLDDIKADRTTRQRMVERAYQNLKNKTDFSFEEARAAARSL